ncbi:hypothetical protein BCR34DRAFT_221367 [Clohesyomyces aquaticus]|uniref:Fungal N-terminal domain-containing protein n=1 Tax=Clohesyomyces aquaticus TaxID=1231657 RepID=A0A1Y1Y8R8_9PLEO|nr:hypothetical protein BCR34DRAFT_221367 [Clohesyomyces aquaticus]
MSSSCLTIFMATGLEILGIAASIIQLADTGLKLSTGIFAYISSVRHADERLDVLAKNVGRTADVVRQFGALLEEDEFANAVGEEGRRSASQCQRECEEAFGTVQVFLDKTRKSKSIFPFRENNLDLLNAQLESLKTHLSLVSHILRQRYDLKTALKNRELRDLRHTQLLEEFEKLRAETVDARNYFQKTKTMAALECESANPDKVDLNTPDYDIQSSGSWPIGTRSCLTIDEPSPAQQTTSEVVRLEPEFGRQILTVRKKGLPLETDEMREIIRPANRLMVRGPDGYHQKDRDKFFREDTPAPDTDRLSKECLQKCHQYIQAILDRISVMQNSNEEKSWSRSPNIKTRDLVATYETSCICFENELKQFSEGCTISLAVFHQLRCPLSASHPVSTPEEEHDKFDMALVNTNYYRRTMDTKDSTRLKEHPKGPQALIKKIMYSLGVRKIERTRSGSRPPSMRGGYPESRTADGKRVQYEELDKLLREWTTVMEEEDNVKNCT